MHRRRRMARTLIIHWQVTTEKGVFGVATIHDKCQSFKAAPTDPLTFDISPFLGQPLDNLLAFCRATFGLTTERMIDEITEKL